MGDDAVFAAQQRRVTEQLGAAMLAAFAAVMFMGAILEMKEAALWRSCGLTE